MKRDDTAQRPKTGISLLVIRQIDGREHVLLGQRAGSHGADQWGTPGGHQEFGELFEETALNELKEECGDQFEVTYPRFLCVTNLREYLIDGKHYTDIGMVAHWVDGDPMLMEPDKCLGWSWHPIDRLPTPLFAPVENLVLAYHTGQPYFG